jgi:hypothetical protein
MDRMKRNGLLTLVAVLMALALIVRLENAAQAQIFYDPYGVSGNPLAPLDIGDFVIIGNDGFGNTVILESNNFGLDYIPGIPGLIPPYPGGDYAPTELLDTVFWNLGGPSFIDARHAKSVISSEYSPAIYNGQHATTVTDFRFPRIFLQVDTAPGGGLAFQYVVYWFDINGLPVASPDTGNMYPGPGDPLLWDDHLAPGFLAPIVLPNGGAVFPEGAAGDPVVGAIDPPFTTMSVVPGLYGPPSLGVITVGTLVGMQFTIMDTSGINPPVTTPPNILPLPGYPPPPENFVGETIVLGGGLGWLMINNRSTRDPHKFDGDDRTLITSTGLGLVEVILYDNGEAIPPGPQGYIREAATIENIGYLDVFDSVIQAGFGAQDLTGRNLWVGGIGITQEYLRTFTPVFNTDTPPVQINEIASLTSLGSVRLFNTQIGEPTGAFSSYFDPFISHFDDSWGIFLPSGSFEPLVVTWGGIEMEMGTHGWEPKPILSMIEATNDFWAGAAISVGSKLANDRIIAGQNVVLERFAVGHIDYLNDGSYPPNNSEMQHTIYDILAMQGPVIGIHAFPTPGVFFGGADNVYTSAYRDNFTSYFSPNMRSIESIIQLNDNSWIFADTGISFGGGGGSLSTGIRVTVDPTSGIFSSGAYPFPGGLFAPFANTTTIFMPGLDGGYGITDRYSMIALVAHAPTPFTYPLWYANYSGSFHEVRVEGKVISGAPSRTGIRFSPGIDALDMTAADKRRLERVYYYDPTDPDAIKDQYSPEYGRVYYTLDTAHKFMAFDNQPNRAFWIHVVGLEPQQLTLYDYATQRWTVNPEAWAFRTWSNGPNNALRMEYFAPFDFSFGTGLDFNGTSIAWEGVIGGIWSAYFGPTVREITVQGDDALVRGGDAFHQLIAYYGAAVGNPYQNTFTYDFNGTANGGAAMHFGYTSHVSKVIIGDNLDVKNLTDVLFVTDVSSGMGTGTSNPRLSARNYQAFDAMTSLKRGKVLYDPLLAFSDSALTAEEEAKRFQFDNKGVHGDIISFYNAVAAIAVGTFGAWGPAGWVPSEDGDAYAAAGTGMFWAHPGMLPDHPAGTYITEFLIPASNPPLAFDGATEAPSYLIGHRSDAATGATISSIDIAGTSLILDEILLNYIAGMGGRGTMIGNWNNSYGYAGSGGDNPRHFREALARLIHYNPLFVDIDTDLYASELLAGYTRDGTLIVFSNGDIFSGNIYGGGFRDPLLNDRWVTMDITTGAGMAQYWVPSNPAGYGNIDLRFVDGTTIFNRNMIEVVDGSNIYRDAGIRVRDVFVEKTGHLLLNDAMFAVNPFVVYGGGDYAQRLIIHDVYNEGIISGNGTFMIGQRYDSTLPSPVDYFVGYLVNRGILAPGLPGFIGENDVQARNLEKEYYENLLKKVTSLSGDVHWESLVRGIPGGQYGTINVLGHLYLMDEHERPIYYDPGGTGWAGPNWNTMEKLPAGEYHVTIGNDTIGSTFGKYAAAIKNATSIRKEVTRPDGVKTFIYDESLLPAGQVSKEDWQIIATEKLATHLSWFSPSTMVDHKGLPLLTAYEQFEYLTDPKRRAALQRQMIVKILGADSQELRRYDSDPAFRATVNERLLAENNIRFGLTRMDNLLMRFGFSDVVSVHGTIPTYIYESNGWGTALIDHGTSWTLPSYGVGNLYLGTTQLGGIIQADRIFDLDDNAAYKEKQTQFIIIASEDYTGSIKSVTSATNKWVYANVELLPYQLATGQTAAVLTVIDDENYYRNRVARGGKSSNAEAVAEVLDNAMFTNPGLAQSAGFGINSPEVLNDLFRQLAAGTRANSIVMNLSSPWDNLFGHIGYGSGGLSTGGRGDITFRNLQTGQVERPFGRAGVPSPGSQFGPPMQGQYRGQSPFYRTAAVWGAYTHSNFSMGDDDNSFAYKFNRNGVILGNEWNLTPSSVLGGSVMVHEGNLTSLNDKVKSYDYNFAVYFVAAPFEQFELKSAASFGFQSYKMDRYIRNSDVYICGGNDIFGIDDMYDSETLGYSFNYAVEVARPFTVSPNFVIRPAAGFEYQTMRQNAYSEKMHASSTMSWSGNGMNIADDFITRGGNSQGSATSGTYGLDYQQQNFNRTLVRLGFNTESYFARGGWRFRAYHIGKLTGDRYPESTQSFTSGSQLFTVRGADLGNSYAQVGLGANLWLNRERTATLFANGDWNFSLVNRGYSMLNVNTGVMFNF